MTVLATRSTGRNTSLTKMAKSKQAPARQQFSERLALQVRDATSSAEALQRGEQDKHTKIRRRMLHEPPLQAINHLLIKHRHRSSTSFQASDHAQTIDDAPTFNNPPIEIERRIYISKASNNLKYPRIGHPQQKKIPRTRNRSVDMAWRIKTKEI